MSLLFATLLVGLAPAPLDTHPEPPATAMDEVEVFAYLDAEELKLGGEYEFVVAVNFPAGSNGSKAGSPAPFLQLDVPAGIKLLEPALTTHKQLAANEFLQEPYERLMKESEVSIPFKLVAELAPGASIGMNVLAYVSGKKGQPDYFFRRRLELPLYPGAEAEHGNDAKSDWGTDPKLLQIGQKAAPFLLPNAKGELVSSADFLGKQNLIVSTYRAHW